MSVRIITGDALEQLRQLAAGSVRCCVTSPPYWGLRDYGVEGQIGLERTPEEWCAKLVAVFREVRRVLADDGTLWLNLGDTYAASGRGGGGNSLQNNAMGREITEKNGFRRMAPPGFKQKDLCGTPWMVAFALRADGWYLRSDIIWSKPNPMPESVTDRPTKAHEYLFLLSKSERYYYDAAAIAEPLAEASIERLAQPSLAAQEGSDRVPGKTNGKMKAVSKYHADRQVSEQHRTKDDLGGDRFDETLAACIERGTRNARTVWEIATQPFKEAHFATFPPELARRCIAAGSARGDTVLDPFGGAGTTGLVADRLGRHAVLIELNPKYVVMAEQRIKSDAPLFTEAGS